MGDLFLFLVGVALLILTVWLGMKIVSSVFRGALDLLEQASEFGFIGLVLYFGAWFFILPIMLIWSFFVGLDDKSKKSADSLSIGQKYPARKDMASREEVSRKRPMDSGILDSLDELPHENGKSVFTLDLGEQGYLPTHKWKIYRPKILPHPLNKFPVTFYFFYHQNALFADNFLQITHHGGITDNVSQSIERLKREAEWMIRDHAIGSGHISDLVVEYRQSTINEAFENVVFTTYKKGSHFHQGFDVHIADQKYSFSIECADQEFEGLFRTALKSAMESFHLKENAY